MEFDSSQLQNATRSVHLANTTDNTAFIMVDGENTIFNWFVNTFIWLEESFGISSEAEFKTV